jgi:S-adenosylmethionine:tRNA ribosyltransferase-isomerase
MQNPDMLLSSYDYDVPKELIAQTPADARQASRLFVIDRASGSFSHKTFQDITQYFDANDCLIINTAKVAPSRIYGKKETGGRVEVLLLKPYKDQSDSLPPAQYQVLVKPFLDVGSVVFFEDGFEGKIISKTSEGASILEFNKLNVSEFLEKHGIMPLPPYIKRKNEYNVMDALDKERYQTVYAKTNGAIAAPTAGLHFTKEILEALESKGVMIIKISLLVGWGTFRPIIAETISEHKMSAERFCVDEESAKRLNFALSSRKCITCVGTTSVRAAESLALKTGVFVDDVLQIKPLTADADMFIYPGYKFKIANRLLTNFHQPQSTPMLLASAFCGRRVLMEAYRQAVKEKYRFFSYGDAMLII